MLVELGDRFDVDERELTARDSANAISDSTLPVRLSRPPESSSSHRQAQDYPPPRAGGRHTHSFATRKASVTKLLICSRSWTSPSHKFIYACVRITPSTYQTWREISSPTSAELLQHVHSSARHRFQSLHDFRDDYLKSFHRLQHLTLNWVRNFPPLWTHSSSSSAISQNSGNPSR